LPGTVDKNDGIKIRHVWSRGAECAAQAEEDLLVGPSVHFP
jgi:hypothetical protein